MSEAETTIFYLQLAMLAVFARLGGEWVRRRGVPVVIGEIVAGVILGPTVLQKIVPHWHHAVFPAVGNNATMLAGITALGATLFLLAAGMEVDLPLVRGQGRQAAAISVAGIAVPLLIGFCSALLFPRLFVPHAAAHKIVFAMFLGVVLSLTALPVTARILRDRDLFHTSFGMLVIAAAVIDDLTGWVLFGIVLAFDHLHDVSHFEADKIIVMAALTATFVVFMLTLGRRAVDGLLHWLSGLGIQATDLIGFTMGLALFGAAFTQWIGIHGLFGAFLVGVAVGGSKRLPNETRHSIEGVVNNFLAPLFFASVGLKVNFIANFRLSLVLAVLFIACLGKIGGCLLAAHFTQMPRSRAWAVAMAMNARGGMEIILGLVALQEHIIEEHMFVALAIMAVATSALTGPSIHRFLDVQAERKEAP